MRLVVISDLHFKLGTWSPFIKEYEGIYYPKINLQHCCEIAKKYNCDAILVLGDVFDRKINPHSIIDIVCQTFEEVSVEKPVYCLIGNHDYLSLPVEDKDFFTSLSAIKSESVHIIDTYEEDIFGPETVAVSFPSRKFILEKAEEWIGKTLFTHIGITGFQIHKDMTIPDEFTTEQLSLYKRVITGHYHIPQEKDNIVFVGSPWPLKKDEYDDEKRILVVDTLTDEITSIPSIFTKVREISVKNVKEFERLFEKISSDLKEDFHQKFKIKISSKSIPRSLLVKLQDTFGYHVYVERQDQSEKPVLEISSDETLTKLSLEKILEGYLTEEEVSLLSRERLWSQIFQ